MWGYFSCLGFRNLIYFTQNLNSNFILTIYEQGLLLSIEKYSKDNSID